MVVEKINEGLCCLDLGDGYLIIEFDQSLNLYTVAFSDGKSMLRINCKNKDLNVLRNNLNAILGFEKIKPN